MLLFGQKKVVYYHKYKDLSNKKKAAVDLYLNTVKELNPKKDNQIILMMGIKCFMGQILKIDNVAKKKFPKSNFENQGVAFIKVNKKKRIILKFSDGKKLIIKPKIGYDYIFIYYYKDTNEWAIENYDYPYLHPEE